ncbi:LOW QUALITY PROTEIN: hypothetical protein ACHAW5_006717 [Stephanodiscus triporus]|uniref:Uncharacterized protein n=1 Tax=Stephanodiscus triporus TaxID=2934178 RepID=A0ABD3N0D2_9STRA
MPTATEIILEYVCPLLGCIVAYVMFMALMSDEVAILLMLLLFYFQTYFVLFIETTSSAGEGCARGRHQWYAWILESYAMGRHDWQLRRMNLFVLVPNAYGFMVSVWLNMAAVKLQYSDRMAASLRSSFVQLLDSNRKSFRGLDRRENIKDAAVGGGGDAPVQTFANLRKMALEITTQKAEAPAPHEKVWKLVIGIIANINTFFFYGAPLSTIVTVLKTRDSRQVKL